MAVREAVIVDVVRTAFGKRNGALAGWHPTDLLGFTLRHLVDKNRVDPELLEDVVCGCVTQSGEQGCNVGRNAVIANATCFSCGPYRVPNATIDGIVVYTNNPPAGAMRGFGSVQNAYAHEAQMDRLAAALGMDPVELRVKNALKTGDVLITGQVIDGPVPVAERPTMVDVDL